MITKKKVLVGSLVAMAIAYIFANPVFFHICVNTYTFDNYVGCFDKFSELISMLLAGASIPLLLFSLITYKMREEIFQAWWGFARWWVAVIIAVTLFFANVGGGSGFGIGGAVSSWFSGLIFGLLYFTFIASTIAKIAHAHLRLKFENRELPTIKTKKINNIFKLVYGIIALPIVSLTLGVIGLMLFNN